MKRTFKWKNRTSNSNKRLYPPGRLLTSLDYVSSLHAFILHWLYPGLGYASCRYQQGLIPEILHILAEILHTHEADAHPLFSTVN